jgi:hypothetical protein
MSNPTTTYNFRNERLDAVLEQSMKIYTDKLEVVLKFKIDFKGVYAVGLVGDAELGYHAFDNDHFSYSIVNGEKGDRIELSIPFPPDVLRPTRACAGRTFNSKNDIPTRHYFVKENTSNEISMNNENHVKLTCFKCKTITYRPNKCNACGNTGMHVVEAKSGCFAVFCNQCRRGFSTWNCRNCGIENAITENNASIPQSLLPMIYLAVVFFVIIAFILLTGKPINRG